MADSNKEQDALLLNKIFKSYQLGHIPQKTYFNALEIYKEKHGLNVPQDDSNINIAFGLNPDDTPMNPQQQIKQAVSQTLAQKLAEKHKLGSAVNKPLPLLVAQAKDIQELGAKYIDNTPPLPTQYGNKTPVPKYGNWKISKFSDTQIPVSKSKPSQIANLVEQCIIEALKKGVIQLSDGKLVYLSSDPAECNPKKSIDIDFIKNYVFDPEDELKDKPEKPKVKRHISMQIKPKEQEEDMIKLKLPNTAITKDGGGPPGLASVSIGHSMKLSVNYNSYEANFQATFDMKPETNLEVCSKWVMDRCKDQLDKLLVDQNIKGEN